MLYCSNTTYATPGAPPTQAGATSHTAADLPLPVDASTGGWCQRRSAHPVQPPRTSCQRRGSTLTICLSFCASISRGKRRLVAVAFGASPCASSTSLPPPASWRLSSTPRRRRCWRQRTLISLRFGPVSRNPSASSACVSTCPTARSGSGQRVRPTRLLWLPKGGWPAHSWQATPSVSSTSGSQRWAGLQQHGRHLRLSPLAVNPHASMNCA